MEFRDNSIKALVDLGMTKMEALIYLALLIEPGTTGYKIGKTIGKAVPNVYQGLDSLMKKGAVILHYSDKDKRYSPVPVTEFVTRLRSELQQRALVLEEELRNLHPVPENTGIYKLDNQVQLFSRIEALIDGSSCTILLTADNEYILRLRTQLENAPSRGVKTMILTISGDIVIEGCEMLRLNTGPGGAWPGHWIVLDMDGIQHVIAYFEELDTLTHAIWCNDQYVSFWIHYGMLADFTLMTFFKEAGCSESLEAMLERLRSIYAKYNLMRSDVKSLYTFFSCEDGADTVRCKDAE